MTYYQANIRGGILVTCSHNFVFGMQVVSTKEFLAEPRHTYRGTQRQFSENICSEDDLRFRIFETFAVKFLAFLPL